MATSSSDNTTSVPSDSSPLAALGRLGKAGFGWIENAASVTSILIFRAILQVVVMWRVEVRNEAALLNTFGRPALLVANHTSHLDFIVLNALFKKRYGATITFLAKRELWDSRLWRLLIRYGNAIPVDRAQFGIGTLRAMKGVLAGGHFMGMFPEGTRSEDGLMGPIKPGLEFIARLHPDMVYSPAASSASTRPGLRIARCACCCRCGTGW